MVIKQVERIHTIIPATGWSAVFAEQDKGGEWEAIAVPLVCFALQEDAHGEQTIVDCDGGDYIDSVEVNQSFLGYLGPGQSVVDWDEAARAFGERERRQISGRRSA